MDYAGADDRFVTETPYQSYTTWADPVTGSSWDRQYKHDDRIEWTAGAFYYDARSFLGGRVELAEFNASGFIPEFDQNDKFWTTNKSAFVHLAVGLTE